MKAALIPSAVLAVLLSVPVSGTAQPVTPVLNESVKLLASDGQPVDAFGGAVAISGDTIVVGAYVDDATAENAGSAYVYVRSGTTWTERAKLLASDGAGNDFFGTSVAISGDVIVVGANADDNAAENSGSAYVFVKPVAGWSGTLHETAKLLASDGAPYDQFGWVAMSGDTVIVSASSDDDYGTSSGSAYVFVRPPGGWSGTLNESAKLLASDGAIYDHFGSTIAVSGDTVVVGASWDQDNGEFSGSAYVIEKPAGGWAGTVHESAKLLPSDGASGDYFGGSAAISGNFVFVGAYVFEKPGGGWSGTRSEIAKLAASDGVPVGVAAASGDRVLAGNPDDDDNGVRSGSAYVFERPAAGWSGTVHERVKLLPSDGEAYELFGVGGISEGTVVGGAFADNGYTGSAYVFHLPSDLTGPYASDVAASPNPAVLNQAITVSATIGGHFDIVAAEYEVRWPNGEVVLAGAGNGSVCPSPQYFCAQDGAFDGVTEHAVVSIPPGTLPAGTLDVCVRGTDADDNTGEFACRRLVTAEFAYDFEGLYLPPPALNRASADRKALVVKFTLHGDYGLSILAAGSPQSVAIPCATNGAPPPADSAPTKGRLFYKQETDRYEYVWLTDPAWRGTCRQFSLLLDDGTVHEAYFHFAN